MNAGFDPGDNHDNDVVISMHHRRHRKQVIESDPEDEFDASFPKYSRPEVATPTYSMDTDISTLEAPTFTTLNQGPSQTMMALRWDHPVNLIGKKVVSPILHICDKCQLPILSYGRLSCKHVLCFACAQARKDSGGQCSRCNVKVSSVEQAGLGNIFMCAYGGSRYGPDGCRRTYLSERDLQAHIKFRHVDRPSKAVASLPSAEDIAAATAAIVAENNSRKLRTVTAPPQVLPTFPNLSQPPPSLRTSTNLITVPIQDNAGSNDYWTTSKVPIHQPPPNYYHHQRPPTSQYNSNQSVQDSWTSRTSGSYRR